MMQATRLRDAAWLLLMALNAIASAGCNTRTPALDNPVLTTAPSAFTSTVPAPNVTPAVDVIPAGIMGGKAGRVYVSFAAPPPEGTSVTVRASDPAVSVTPSQIEWPRNAFSAEVTYTSAAVSADRNVEIVASTAYETRSARLTVWAPAPSFFAFSSDRNAPEAASRSGRLLPPDMQVEAFCSTGEVVINVRPNAASGLTPWFLRMSAPIRTPLQPGVYEGSSRYQVSVSNNGPTPTNCQRRSRMTVHDIELRAPSQVMRLWATLEQSCANTGATTRVDVRLDNPPRPAGPLSSCLIQ